MAASRRSMVILDADELVVFIDFSLMFVVSSHAVSSSRKVQNSTVSRLSQFTGYIADTTGQSLVTINPAPEDHLFARSVRSVQSFGSLMCTCTIAHSHQSVDAVLISSIRPGRGQTRPLPGGGLKSTGGDAAPLTRAHVVRFRPGRRTGDAGTAN